VYVEVLFMLLTIMTFFAGAFFGWVAHHYGVTRYLLWTIRDMKKEGHVYLAGKPTTMPAPPPPWHVNED